MGKMGTWRVVGPEDEYRRSDKCKRCGKTLVVVHMSKCATGDTDYDNSHVIITWACPDGH